MRGALEDILHAPGLLPAEILPKVIELATILQAQYQPVEWDNLCARIRDAFGLEEEALAKRFTSSIVNMAIEDVPLAEDISFPALVTEGWFGQYLEYTAESEAPTQFHFGAAITTLAACLGRMPLIGWEALPTYPNLYTLLIGPTGARKSTAIRLATDLLKPALGDRLNILPSEGSQQGFAQALRKRNFEVTKISDGLVVASELTVLLGQDKYKTDLHKWLTDWYDCPPSWSRALRSEDYYELIAPYVCLVSASNMEWLKSMPHDAIKGGFLPRILLFDAPGKRHRKAQPRFYASLRNELQRKVVENLEAIPETLCISKEGNDLIEDWYITKIAAQEEEATDELFMAWLARKLPHALKLACVWQLVDGGPPGALEAEWLARAMGVVDWMDGGVLRVYGALGVSDEGAVQEDVMGVLRRKKGRASQAEIVRGLRNKYNSVRVQGGLRTLQIARKIKQDSNPVEGAVWVITGR
jgi:hypothetical protein